MQFMPMLVLALAVIPGGIEGVSYAMMTTWMNVASEVGAKKGQTEVNAPLSPPLFYSATVVVVVVVLVVVVVVVVVVFLFFIFFVIVVFLCL
jgi:hypothetical protein